MQNKQVVVLGAGMVGVCSALALQKRGFQVTLVDKLEPGSETSFGNAGMITPSSLIPFNNPRIFKSLPGFLTNSSDGFRYNLAYVLSEMQTLIKFLVFSKQQTTEKRINHLYQLIERSISLHLEYTNQLNIGQSLRHSGWLKLYRQAKSFQNSTYEQDIYNQYNIQFKLLNAQQVTTLEPNLKPIYSQGLLINDALSVASPQDLVSAYAQHFLKCGGESIIFAVNQLKALTKGWLLADVGGEAIQCEHLVIATGPWSKQLLAPLGIKLPMIFERGAHREYSCDTDGSINLPIHDIDGNFVASPNQSGVRISCGVELNRQQADYSDVQLNNIEKNARQGLDFSQQWSSQWQGARPTLPDSMPVIGATKRPNLWINSGHQHIGFSTGPASAEILANIMSDATTELNPFCPSRFKL